MSTVPQGHLVIFALEGWGHTRPLCTLAVRTILEKPLHVTFLVPGNFVERAKSELTRNLGPDAKEHANLIRVIGLHTTDIPDIRLSAMNAIESFKVAFAELMDEKAVTCAQSGVKSEPIISPTGLILDMFFGDAIPAARELSKNTIKILAVYSGAASFAFYPFGPTRLGGRGDFRPKVFEEVAKTGRPIEEVAEEILLGVDGTVIRVPGLPPMYDYEYHPQEMLFVNVAGVMWIGFQQTIERCDGMILTTPEVYEPEAVAGWRDWFHGMSKTLHVVGPLLPLSDKESVISGETQQSQNGPEIEQFLNQVLQSHGPRSLLYISFGSLFWPKYPNKLWTFLDVVMEKKIPFILGHASPFASIPEDIAAKIKAYGLGLTASWTPQQTILAHPATSWFVSHCGHNSAIEAATLGVPLICWPYHADQGTNAAQLTCSLDVGYELMEIRSGHGLQPLHRTGVAPVGTLDALRQESIEVLDKAFGDDGEAKRANMKKLQSKILSSWASGGPAELELKDLVHLFMKH